MIIVGSLIALAPMQPLIGLPACPAVIAGYGQALPPDPVAAAPPVHRAAFRYEPPPPARPSLFAGVPNVAAPEGAGTVVSSPALPLLKLPVESKIFAGSGEALPPDPVTAIGTIIYNQVATRLPELPALSAVIAGYGEALPPDPVAAAATILVTPSLPMLRLPPRSAVFFGVTPVAELGPTPLRPVQARGEPLRIGVAVPLVFAGVPGEPPEVQIPLYPIQARTVPPAFLGLPARPALFEGFGEALPPDPTPVSAAYPRAVAFNRQPASGRAKRRF